MQKTVVVAILALMVLALVAAPAFATETNAQTAPPVVTTAPQQTDTGSFLQGLQERLTAIGSALVVVMLIVAGIVSWWPANRARSCSSPWRWVP